MPLYETVLVVRQDLSSSDVDSLADKFIQIISDFKGSLVSKEYWGIRKLSHKIKKFSHAHYVLLNFESPATAIEQLKKVIGYQENVLRSLTFKVDSHSKNSPLFLSSSAQEYSGSSKKFDAIDNDYSSIIDQLNFDS